MYLSIFMMKDNYKRFRNIANALVKDKDGIVIKKLQLNKLQLKLQLVVTYCKNFFNIKIYN